MIPKLFPYYDSNSNFAIGFYFFFFITLSIIKNISCLNFSFVKGSSDQIYFVKNGLKHKAVLHGLPLSDVKVILDSELDKITSGQDYHPHQDYAFDYNFSYVPGYFETGLVSIPDHSDIFVRVAKKVLHVLNVKPECIDRSKIIALSPSDYTKGMIDIATAHPWKHHVSPALLLRHCWVLQTEKFQQRVTSQGGQDGLLKYIFHNIGSTNKYFIEFGYDGSKPNGVNGANTFQLNVAHGFKGLLLDIRFSNPAINLQTETITPANIVSIFKKHKVPREADYLSIDIDSTDLWVFRAIISSEFRPRVVSVEYNCNFPVTANITCADNCIAFACRMFGSSIGALNMVANEFGYSAVAVVRQLDIFFVRNDVLQAVPGLLVPELSAYAHLAGIPYYRECTYKGVKAGFGLHWGEGYVGNYTVDYGTWVHTKGDITAAKLSGVQQLRDLGLYKHIVG